MVKERLPVNRKLSIDVVNLCYSLEIPEQSWLPALCEMMSRLTGGALTVVGMRAIGFEPGAGPRVTEAHCAGDREAAVRVVEAARQMGPAMVAETHGTMGGMSFLVMDLEDRFPEAVDIYRRVIGCQDVLLMSAVDPDYSGVGLHMVSAKRLKLAKGEWETLFQLSVHIAAADRLRRGLGSGSGVGETLEQFDPATISQAILDPKDLRVEHAESLESASIKALREQAKLVDQARGPLRKTDPETALRIWQGLVRGRWSLIDWFDSDGRRFVLARPNAPKLGDPRGLTEREMQVATYAAKGESGKHIGYRFGISTSHVSVQLKSAMRKLGVKTQAELVARMRPMSVGSVST